VKDDTWVKPPVEERPEGVVDWKALEENYILAEQRYKPASEMNMGQMDDWKPELLVIKPPKSAPVEEEVRSSAALSGSALEQYKTTLKALEDSNKARLKEERLRQADEERQGLRTGRVDL